MNILSKFIIFLSLGFALNVQNSDIYDNSWALIIGINKYKIQHTLYSPTQSFIVLD